MELSKSWDGKEKQVREGAGLSGTDDGSWRVEPLCFLTSIYIQIILPLIHNVCLLGH